MEGKARKRWKQFSDFLQTVFYSERNLIIKNFQRTHSFKISFSLRESLLVVVEVDSEGDCLKYHLEIYKNPSTPFTKINKNS